MKLVITEAFALVYQITEVILILEAVNQVRPNIFFRFDKCKSIHIFLLLTVPEPVVEEPDCRIDTDCPSLEMCYLLGSENRCVDPCTTISPCVAHASCKVHSTTPTRTMSCTCFEGYTGNGVVSCDKISKIKIRLD